MVVAFWTLLTVTPAGRSNLTDHPLSAVVDALATTNLPLVPVREKVAVMPVAACAGTAKASTATKIARRAGIRRMRNSRLVEVRGGLAVTVLWSGPLGQRRGPQSIGRNL